MRGKGWSVEDGPRPVDVHVGNRIRLRRTLLGLSQEQLAEGIGVSFQQVQKYERGANRVSASRLYDIAQILAVRLEFFFDGFEGGSSDEPVTPDPMQSNETLRLVNAFVRLPSYQRESLLDLLESMRRG